MPKLRRSRIRELVRQFKENGMKMMLEHPANVRDLLRSRGQRRWSDRTKHNGRLTH